jgi:hypothetical protein
VPGGLRTHPRVNMIAIPEQMAPFVVSGTVEEKVDASVSGKSCLSTETVLKLAKLGIELEKRFRSPRDIEFAVKQVRKDLFVAFLFRINCPMIRNSDSDRCGILFYVRRRTSLSSVAGCTVTPIIEFNFIFVCISMRRGSIIFTSEI